MAKLPKIYEREYERRLEELHSNLIVARFPKTVRDGLYSLAIEKLEDWRNGDLSIEKIYNDRKHPISIALRLYHKDLELYEFAKRKEKALLQNKLKEKSDPDPTT